MGHSGARPSPRRRLLRVPAPVHQGVEEHVPDGGAAAGQDRRGLPSAQGHRAARHGQGGELLPDLGAREADRLPAAARSPVSGSRKSTDTVAQVPGHRSQRRGRPAGDAGAVRSSPSASDWIATRRIYHANGGVHAEPVPGVTFFYARDEHDHWHIKDFHTYQILDHGGTVRRGEKEAFCFEDNTNYRDWGQRPAEYPRVPQDAVYTHEASCGEGDDLAIDIVHGLSPGWGDTYPTTLPDQGVDITDLPDGVYTVSVLVDTSATSGSRTSATTPPPSSYGSRVTRSPPTQAQPPACSQTGWTVGDSAASARRSPAAWGRVRRCLGACRARHVIADWSGTSRCRAAGGRRPQASAAFGGSSSIREAMKSRSRSANRSGSSRCGK